MEFNDVLRDDLPEGLTPKRSVDHKIETLPDEKPPHRGIFQLSPAELIATKEYISDLLRKGKRRPSKSILRSYPPFCQTKRAAPGSDRLSRNKSHNQTQQRAHYTHG